MRTARRDLLLPLIISGILALGFSLPAGGCTTDAECDNGDTCSVPDQCQGDSCVLGGGGDTDNNLVCDDEFYSGSTLRLTRVIIRTFPSAGRSVVRVDGDLIYLTPPGPLSGDDGIAIRVKDHLSSVPPDGDGIDSTLVFGPPDCSTTSDSVTCRLVTGPEGGSLARFKRNPVAPDQIKFSWRLRGLDLTKPFFGPVRVVLTHNTSVYRPGQIIDCRVFPTGIKCREF